MPLANSLNHYRVEYIVTSTPCHSLPLRCPQPDFTDSGFAFCLAQSRFQIGREPEIGQQFDAACQQHLLIHQRAVWLKDPRQRASIAISFGIVDPQCHFSTFDAISQPVRGFD